MYKTKKNTPYNTYSKGFAQLKKTWPKEAKELSDLSTAMKSRFDAVKRRIMAVQDDTIRKVNQRLASKHGVKNTRMLAAKVRKRNQPGWEDLKLGSFQVYEADAISCTMTISYQMSGFYRGTHTKTKVCWLVPLPPADCRCTATPTRQEIIWNNPSYMEGVCGESNNPKREKASSAIGCASIYRSASNKKRDPHWGKDPKR